MKTKPQELAIYLAAAIMLTSAGAYHLRKWDKPQLAVSQSDLDGICQSAPGCKALKLGWSAEKGTWSTSIKVLVIASKKAKNSDIETSVGNAVRQLVESKNQWLEAGLTNQKIEVRYE